MPVALAKTALLRGLPVRPSGAPVWPPVDPAIEAALQDSWRRGDWGRYDGPCLQALRSQLSAMHAADHVILCGSGTSAVELALRGLQVGSRPGDEVLLAGYDFRGNFLNVVAVGAAPVLVDIDPVTGQLDVTRVAAAITPQTRAIVASHLHGGVVDLRALREVAETYGIAILEDACQTPGAVLPLGMAGMQGDVGVISFGGSKLLSAGRGGAVLTNRDDVAARIRRHNFRGNEVSPLSELQATVLLPQLDQLSERRSQRRRTVAALDGSSCLPPCLQRIKSPDVLGSPDYYKVAFRYDAGGCGHVSRAVFAAALRAEGFAVFPGFRGLHRLHARGRYRAVDALAEATAADESWLLLHHPVLLEGPDVWQQFVAAIEKIQDEAELLKEFEDSRGTVPELLGEEV